MLESIKKSVIQWLDFLEVDAIVKEIKGSRSHLSSFEEKMRKAAEKFLEDDIIDNDLIVFLGL